MRWKIVQLIAAVVLANFSLAAQTTPQQAAPVPGQNADPQPAAPPDQTLTNQQEGFEQRPQPPAPQPISLPGQLQLNTTGPLHRLTIQEAEELAIKNNPQISVYRLIYLASNQVTREQQAAYYPDSVG